MVPPACPWCLSQKLQNLPWLQPPSFPTLPVKSWYFFPLKYFCKSSVSHPQSTVIFRSCHCWLRSPDFIQSFVPQVCSLIAASWSFRKCTCDVWILARSLVMWPSQAAESLQTSVSSSVKWIFSLTSCDSVCLARGWHVVTISDDGGDGHSLLRTFSGLPVALKSHYTSCHTSLVLILLRSSAPSSFRVFT